jgi:hypothetical protein
MSAGTETANKSEIIPGGISQTKRPHMRIT